MTRRKDRRFPWEEARSRRVAGETFRAIAESYGVSHAAVQRVVKLPAKQVRALAERLRSPLRYQQNWCPRCHQPKYKRSELCLACSKETRFRPVRIKRVPGEADAILGGVRIGCCVRVDDRWGVVIRSPVHAYRTWRAVDFWEGGPELVDWWTQVEVAESVRVFVGKEAQDPEEIE